MAAPDDTFVVLLRGVNVGGKNIVAMAELRAALAMAGLRDVRTYIQSGNLLCAAEPASGEAVGEIVRGVLAARFAIATRVAVLSVDQLAMVVAEAPPGFGSEPDVHRDDVLFVLPPTQPDAVLKELPRAEGIDSAWAGRHAVYFRRVAAAAARSRLSRLAQLPVYTDVTIRNWNTTTKLLAIARRTD